MALPDGFGIPDYIVFGLLLGLSGGIGVFYGYCGKKNSNNEEYLMGNRQCKPLPVAMSLVCSSISAITMLGLPAEVHLYGIQTMISPIALLPMTIALYKIYCPVFFKLQFTSGYQYFEIRFSRTVRMMVSIISTLFLIPYMCLVVYGPSISIALVTGLHHRIIFACIYLVCIFYSTLGGFKAVIYTDLLQGIVMFGSIASVLIVGFTQLGADTVGERLSLGKRTDILIFDPDPRRRHTIWTATIGIFFTWLSTFAPSQANIQRFVSLPTMKTLNRALLYNWIATTILIAACLVCGLLSFAHYIHCDPLANKSIKSPESLLPFYVLEVLGKYPGLPGLFVAGITSASMSTVSSGINAVSAIVIEDYVKAWRPLLNEKKLFLISRLVSLFAGLISFFFVFIAERSSNILSVTHSLIGSLYGPILGIFTLGMMFPHSKAKGVIMGFVTSVSIMVLICMAAAAVNQKKLGPNQRLPLDISQCTGSNSTSSNFTFTSAPLWKEKEYPLWVSLVSFSYNWYSTLGNLLMIFFGLFYSIIFHKFLPKSPISSNYFSPPAIWFWKKVLPLKHLENYIIFENEEVVVEENAEIDEGQSKNLLNSFLAKFHELTKSKKKVFPLPDEIIWSRNSSTNSFAKREDLKDD